MSDVNLTEVFNSTIKEERRESKKPQTDGDALNGKGTERFKQQ
jgi:hypothetical protein